ncbi:MAG: glycosyltransferase family protein [Magnetovibrionaceae bacterium]
MRLLVLSADYPDFLHKLYDKTPGLSEAPYAEQRAARAKSWFGVGDAYPHYFAKAGFEVEEVYVNNPWSQAAWAKEQGLSLAFPEGPSTAKPAGSKTSWKGKLANAIPGLHAWKARNQTYKGWLFDCIGAQIDAFQPDIILNKEMHKVPGRFLAERCKPGTLIAGQIATYLPPNETFRAYDVIYSSLPNLVAGFRAKGIESEDMPLAFDARILAEMESPVTKDIAFSFVGSVSPQHGNRLEVLEYLCRETDLRVWAPSVDALPADSAIRKRYQGPAWGLGMYKILARSHLTLNQHIDVAEGYANNCRLFEATGVGTALLTDQARNLDSLFEPDVEITTYHSPIEAAAIRWHLFEADLRLMAKAGQDRTLKDHSYEARIADYAERLKTRLRKGG